MSNLTNTVNESNVVRRCLYFANDIRHYIGQNVA